MRTFEPKSSKMQRHIFLLLGFLYFSSISLAIDIDYKLGMSRPNSHYFEVEMNVSDLKSKELAIKMPVWAPGSYLEREFANSVNLVTAKDGSGNMKFETQGFTGEGCNIIKDVEAALGQVTHTEATAEAYVTGMGDPVFNELA